MTTREELREYDAILQAFICDTMHAKNVIDEIEPKDTKQAIRGELLWNRLQRLETETELTRKAVLNYAKTLTNDKENSDGRN